MKKRSYISAIIILVLFCQCATVSGEIINIPGDYAAVQYGIDAAYDGDTVLVADGIWTGEGNKNLSWDGDDKHIVVKSENGADSCIIDCEENGRGFSFYDTNQDAFDVIEGFTIQNGFVEDDGGGIVCRSASPVIRNCIFINNLAFFSGGGVYCGDDAEPMITNCEFSLNLVAEEGAGISCFYSCPSISYCTFTGNSAYLKGGGVSCVFSSPSLSHSIFTNNSSYELAGGISCWDESAPTIADCSFSENNAEEGGGILCAFSSCAVISGCSFNANTAHESSGGGVMCSGMSDVVITDCSFNENTVNWYGSGLLCLNSSPIVEDCSFTANSAGWHGGAMFSSGSCPVITDCTFSGNNVCEMGGGLYTDDDDITMSRCVVSENSAGLKGGGIFCESGPSAVFSDASITGNLSGEDGGGFYCRHSSSFILSCTISGNSAVRDGGGLFLEESVPKVSGCKFSGNQAGDEGGGMHCFNSSGCELTNCIFTGNDSGETGGGISFLHSVSPSISNSTFSGNSTGSGGGIYCKNSSPLFYNCIFWDDVPDEIYVYSGGPVVSYSNIQGGYSGTGNINENPLFVSGPEGAYCLSQIASGQGEDSPCIDAGSDEAMNICYEMPAGLVCMNQLTNRTDEAPDMDVLDMGYHYMPSYYETPTPAPTTPPTAAPTVTLTPEQTETPTLTPTVLPTGTPVFSATPEPTATALPYTHVSLEMPDNYFSHGDPCSLTACLHNYSNPITNVPLFVVLEISGQFLFWDGWTDEVDWNRVYVGLGITVIPVLTAFIWPDTGDETMDGLTFWSAMTNQDMTEMLGGPLGIGCWTFGFGPER